MSTAILSANKAELEKINVLLFAQMFQALMECSDGVQAMVREMVAIVVDPESDAQERDMALATIAEALFSKPYNGELGMDLAESDQLTARHCDETAWALEDMDREESEFADRLRSLMEKKGINQSNLAAKIGVGQPAISMMLNRHCRPQQRTVVRIAEALGVAPAELWPNASQSP